MESAQQIIFTAGIGLYVALFLLKAYLQKRKNRVNPLKLAEGRKPGPLAFNERLIKVTSSAFILVVLLSAMQLIGPRLYWESSISSGLGAVIFVFGIGLFVAAMVTMRDSWRAGIDPDTKTELVSGGLYRISRNPAFAGYLAMVSGFAVAYPSAYSAALLIISIIVFHTQILHEEEFLKSRHGSGYEKYMKSVPRYLRLR
jgi:protein-S-isoprenylcysteine O-methyltransferase Ste14